MFLINIVSFILVFHALYPLSYEGESAPRAVIPPSPVT
ncbi:hypothetical protein KNP414_02343 [Paenibacillus mucilaginosus KNP414]|uniref:Uncharacterized protein n=1 Tax=Paenibacillus mucilaginosus (strain KNP414) TaxID=1036673 RepID=F8F593_PAEMK|nr:hypothetical protein KNP414_02343 [Paenibacillus mucilaginosus KNP414]